MTVKKSSLFENIKNSINSVDKSFQPKNNLVNDNIMTVKKSSLFENIKNSINSVDKSFQPKNNLVNDNIMTVKKSSLFENIKNSINSTCDNFKNQFTEKEIFNNIDNKNDGIIENKKIIKTISVDEKTQRMLNELKRLNYKINLSQLVRREVAKIYEELIKEIK